MAGAAGSPPRRRFVWSTRSRTQPNDPRSGSRWVYRARLPAFLPTTAAALLSVKMWAKCAGARREWVLRAYELKAMQRVEMDERELSKLWYLADALVSNATNWQQILKVFAQSPTNPSPALSKATTALREALERHASKLGASDPSVALKEVAAELLKRDEPVKDAGRAMAWALENTPRHRHRVA
jgi:hypothetical protein